jgi:hypothetical protein
MQHHEMKSIVTSFILHTIALPPLAGENEGVMDTYCICMSPSFGYHKHQHHKHHHSLIAFEYDDSRKRAHSLILHKECGT